MRTHVDADRCQGHTLCAMTAPEVFELSDDDGHARVITTEVPVRHEAAVRAAAAGCPELAVIITDQRG